MKNKNSTQKTNTKKEIEQVDFKKFYTFITFREKFYLILGTIGAIIGGGMIPSISIIMGDVTDTFDPSTSPDKVLHDMKKVAIAITILAGCIWIFSYFYFAFWQHLAENITSDLRKRYMQSLMKQEIAFFEKEDVSQLPSQISEYFVTIQQSIGEKFSNILYSLCAVISGVVIAFIIAPLFAIIAFAFFPLLFVAVILFGGAVKEAAIKKIIVLK